MLKWVSSMHVSQQNFKSLGAFFVNFVKKLAATGHLATLLAKGMAVYGGSNFWVFG